MTHKEFTDSLRTFLVEKGKEALLAKLISLAPFLANPIINPVASLLVGKLVTYIFEVTDFAVYVKYVDFRADRQGKAFLEEMKEYLKVKDSDDEEAKAKAREKLTKAFDELVVIQL